MTPRSQNAPALVESGDEVDSNVTAQLRAIYEEVMWLARRPKVTPGRARSWYTHVMAEAVKRQLRRFTGRVSEAAIDATSEPLMLEHYQRIQTALTALVTRHREFELTAPEEFVALVIEYEQVHIVTRSENYAALRAKGDYELAGIRLKPWTDIPAPRREVLWRTMLRGRVSNAGQFGAPADRTQRRRTSEA